MLTVERLIKSYPVPGKPDVKVLDIPYFAMAAGETAALVGPSGSGKSTLLHVIAGIVRPTSGEISLLGSRLDTMSEPELDRFRAHRIGYVFQSYNLLPGFTALENVLAAMRFAASVPRHEQRGRAERLLEQVGLAHRLHHKPQQLSGGEQQRVSIARALANRPALVLADEPTASLDSVSAELAMTLLTGVCAENGAALLLCTHDADTAAAMGRTVAIRELSHGAAAPAGKAG